MKKINIDDLSNDNSLSSTDYSKIYESAFIDVKTPLERPPTALSIGEIQLGQDIYPRELATFGNFSCVTGASKSKKTFFKSLMVAAFIGGQSDKYCGDMKTHRKKDMIILDFDTEQSAWHSQRTFKRISKLVGDDYELYKPFYLRRYPFHERLAFIDYCVNKYKDNLGLVIIDGFADLVKEVNDLVSCNELVTKMLEWTDITQCHLTGILHQNWGSTKATGHLGSAILKKAETVCSLVVDEHDSNFTNVTFPYTRGFPIDDLSFKINNFGLPEIDNNKIAF